MKMLGGGDEIANQCRTPDIMSDAAYVILTKDSKSFTGNFCIDDTILTEAGETDMEKYSCVPGKINIIIFCLNQKYSCSNINLTYVLIKAPSPDIRM